MYFNQRRYLHKMLCIIVVLCLYSSSFPLFFASVTVLAGDTLPQGIWKVEEVTVERSDDGNRQTETNSTANSTGNKIQTTRYKSVAEVKNYVRFPAVLEVVDSHTMLMQYWGVEEKMTAEYTIAGNRITILEGPIGYTYLFRITEGNLVLTLEYEFPGKRTAGRTEILTEKWNFTMSKQQ